MARTGAYTPSTSLRSKSEYANLVPKPTRKQYVAEGLLRTHGSDPEPGNNFHLLVAEFTCVPCEQKGGAGHFPSFDPFFSK